MDKWAVGGWIDEWMNEYYVLRGCKMVNMIFAKDVFRHNAAQRINGGFRV